ncbi:MAG: MMPL family transporter [Akkermansiaceae bacterium]|nr:MMPL family transporter [Akkermansiaceae bacterium]
MVDRGWWVILLLLVGGAVILASFLPQLDINANTDAFLEEEGEAIATYYEAREEWGTDEFAILCVTADDWFSPAGIARLKELEADLKQVPFAESTMSILDIPLLRQDPGRKPNLLRLAAGTTTLRDAGVNLPAARAELEDHELAVGNLISADGRSLNLLAYLSYEKNAAGEYVPGINERRTRMVDGVRALTAKWNERLPEPVRVSGVPHITVNLFESMRHDLIVFGIASLLLFTLAFAVVYRKPRFVIVPIVCCLLPAVIMIGGMAFLGIPLGFVTSNMPLLVFVLMLPYNVYFIERYRERRARHPDEDGFASTLQALRTIAVPCFFSCITTLAGFGALAISPIIPIRDFGRSMTIGMVVGFGVVFLFIPAAFRRLRGSRETARRSGGYRRATGLVRLAERITLARPALVAAVSAAILALSIAGAFRISAENKFTGYFWPGSEVYEGLEFIDQEMGGTTWIEILLSSETDGYFRSRAGLDAIAAVEDYFEGVPETGNIFSLARLRDEMRKAFPKERLSLLGDAVLLRMVQASSPDLVKLTSDPQFRTGRVTVRMKETAPTLHRGRILAGLQRHIADHPAAFDGLEISVTGVFPVYAELLSQLLEGQRQSLLAVPVAVYVILLFLFRSPVLSLLVLLSQALPAAVLLGVMGWAGIPLDLVTVMIASIAIGVGIDAAIQYTMRFRRELAALVERPSPPGAAEARREALRRSHATIGRAIWIATSIIIAGFAILVLSDFFPSVWFGLFTALAMLISQLATLTMLPALFLLTGYPRTGATAPGRPRRRPAPAEAARNGPE